jgi:hypothetical protein
MGNKPVSTDCLAQFNIAFVSIINWEILPDALLW